MAAFLTISTTNNTSIQALEAQDVDAKAVLVIEQSSGQILFQKNPDEVLKIASMSKMATQYLVNEAVANGETSWDAPVTISQRVMDTSANYELSNVPLRTNETYTVKELYEAMSIFSANGATIALAEHLAGTEDQWVERIQAKLTSWGITDASFINASGLPNQYGLSNKKTNLPDNAENSMSARSVAILARHLVTDYPDSLQVSSIAEKVFHPGTIDETLMTNYNLLVPGLLFGRQGVTGLKTGTTDDSGASVTTTATENGMSVISVLIGASQSMARFSETDKILDQVFAAYELLPLVTANNSVKGVTPYPVVDGVDEYLSLNYGKDYQAVVPKGTAVSQISMTFTPNPELLNANNQLKAPIAADQPVGTINISVPGENLGFLQAGEGNQVPALASFEIKEANIFVKLFRSIQSFFKGITGAISGIFG